jgi:hypothetical protein
MAYEETTEATAYNGSQSGLDVMDAREWATEKAVEQGHAHCSAQG